MPDLFERSQSLLRIGGNIHQGGGLWVKTHIMRNADGKVRSHVFMGTDNFRVRRARQLLAHEVMKTRFLARYDKLDRHSSFY